MIFAALLELVPHLVAGVSSYVETGKPAEGLAAAGNSALNEYVPGTKNFVARDFEFSGENPKYQGPSGKAGQKPKSNNPYQLNAGFGLRPSETAQPFGPPHVMRSRALIQAHGPPQTANNRPETSDEIYDAQQFAQLFAEL